MGSIISRHFVKISNRVAAIFLQENSGKKIVLLTTDYFSSPSCVVKSDRHIPDSYPYPRHTRHTLTSLRPPAALPRAVPARVRGRRRGATAVRVLAAAPAEPRAPATQQVSRRAPADRAGGGGVGGSGIVYSVVADSRSNCTLTIAPRKHVHQ